jgi:hypothetical protein
VYPRYILGHLARKLGELLELGSDFLHRIQTDETSLPGPSLHLLIPADNGHQELHQQYQWLQPSEIEYSQVLFQIKDNIYRVLTVYSKTYNKWFEVDPVPMRDLHKTTNLYKVHVCRLVEDVLLFASSRRKFSSAPDRIELLTTGHTIASAPCTVIGHLTEDGNVAKMMDDETKTGFSPTRDYLSIPKIMIGQLFRHSFL